MGLGHGNATSSGSVEPLAPLAAPLPAAEPFAEARLIWARLRACGVSGSANGKTVLGIAANSFELVMVEAQRRTESTAESGLYYISCIEGIWFRLHRHPSHAITSESGAISQLELATGSISKRP